MVELERIEKILADRTHGSSWIALNSLIASRKLAKEGVDPLFLLKLIAKRRREMSALRNLSLVGIELLRRGLKGDEVFARLILEFRKSEEEFAKSAGMALAGYERFVTISDSEQLRIAFLSLTAPRRVYVLESLPGGEGANLRSNLVRLGHSAVTVPDLAMVHVLEKANVALCGCDTLYSTHFVNKLGTRLLSLAATSLGRPLFVCTTMWKVNYSSPEHRSLLAYDFVNTDQRQGVKRKSNQTPPLFESIKNSDVLFVTEDGVLTADQVFKALSGRLSRLFG